MSNALADFITAYLAPKGAIRVAGDFECRDWVHTEEHGWNPCAVRKTSQWATCPNADNHGRPVVKAKRLDEITPGDTIRFYHHASNQDQWATVLAWTPVNWYIRSGEPMEWDAVLHIADLKLGNGFSAGTKVQRHRIEAHRETVKNAYTPGVFQ